LSSLIFSSLGIIDTEGLKKIIIIIIIIIIYHRYDIYRANPDGHRVTESAILAGSGRVGSRVRVSDPVFDPVLSFNMHVYRGIVSTE